MKKQTNQSAGARKLSLNKKTISNLTVAEMNGLVGGGPSKHCSYAACGGTNGHCGAGTRNGNTCPGHNTCYTC